MTLPLVLLGSGGFARELLGWISKNPMYDNPVAMIQEKSGASNLGVEVLDFESISHPVRFIVAVSSPDVKEKLISRALSLSWRPVSYIDNNAVLGLNVQVGLGSVICPFSTISSNVCIGNYVTVNCRSAVGHESSLGDFSTLLGSNSVNGNVEVADRVILGAGAIIHPGRKIGSRATVGIGSVVLTNVKEKTVVFGNPAKRISTGQTA